MKDSSSKGAKNKKEGMKYIAFNAQPKPQANYGMGIFYGPTNKKAWDYIDPKLGVKIAGNPAMYDRMINIDGDWWAQNEEKVLKRWNEWMLK